LSTRSVFSKDRTGKFIFTDYTKGISGSSKTDIAGSVSDEAISSNQLITDLLAEYKKDISEDFSLSVVAGFQSRDNTYKNVYIAANGLVISDVYNINNTLTNLGGGSMADDRNVEYHSTQFGLYGDVRLGFKDFAYLHFTGRNDWRSVLSAENRSFFYPAVDVSIILSEAISSMQNSNLIDALKIRGGYSQVGQVNIDPYALNATFGQQYGYPYGSGGGFGLGNTLVSPNLEPEITTSVEAGFDLDLKKYAASIGMTVYKSNTVDQTIPVQISSASGYNTLRTNVGEVENQGIETYLRVTPIETTSGLTVSLQATYTLNRNKVVSLSDQSDLMILQAVGSIGRIVAKEGEPFPFLQVTTYNRTPEGKVIVDPNTGFPASGGTYQM
jgi:outer membrane receptor protein involved in Fe transport